MEPEDPLTFKNTSQELSFKQCPEFHLKSYLFENYQSSQQWKSK